MGRKRIRCEGCGKKRPLQTVPIADISAEFCDECARDFRSAMLIGLMYMRDDAIANGNWGNSEIDYDNLRIIRHDDGS